MTRWVAESNGALDLRGHDLESDGFDLVVTPTVAGVPLFLIGAGAGLWRRVVESGVDDHDLDADERAIVQEFVAAGIASESDGRATGGSSVDRPWLSSIFHELVYALLARIAAENQIRLIFIKGPTLHAQGLREREHSGDVDCLVLPGEDLRLARAMEEWGWSPVITPLTGTGVSHSLTLTAPSWACAIDVHTRFPGIALDPVTAFELIGRRGEERRFASTVARTPCPSDHAVISALHAMRPYLGHPPDDARVQAAADTLRAAGDGVVDHVIELRAGYVLREPLRRAFPSAEIPPASARAPFDWEWRSTPQGARRHLKAVGLVPLRLRLRTVARLVWPARSETSPSGTSGVPDTAPRRRMRRIMDALSDLARHRGR